jgi:hypothetical protein
MARASSALSISTGAPSRRHSSWRPCSPLRRRGRVGGVDRAVPRRFAADLMFLDQRKHVLGRRAEALDEAAAICRAEGRAHRRGRVPDTGIHETHVPARPAMADAFAASSTRQSSPASAPCSAVDRPVNPPPTMATSAVASPSRGVSTSGSDRRAVPEGNPFCRRPCCRPSRDAGSRPAGGDAAPAARRGQFAAMHDHRGV